MAPDRFSDLDDLTGVANRRKGVCVVLSDFFDKSGYENALRYVAGGNYDLFCVQTLASSQSTSAAQHPATPGAHTACTHVALTTHPSSSER